MHLTKAEVLTDIREAAFRTFAIIFAAFFVWRGAMHFVQDPGRINVLLLTISEGLSFTWLLLSRRPLVRDWNPLTIIVSLVAGFGGGMITLEPGVEVVPLFITAPLQFAALWFVIYAKVSIGRSFAILPANRGVVTAGAYRLVRHPIYAGYLSSHVIFLMSSFSFYNLAIYSILTFFQVHRLLREEALLAHTPEYRDYMHTVPYRLFYGIV